MSVLYCSRLSPYAAKVRIASVHVGYPCDARMIDTWEPEEAFIVANPLGKVPVLVTDEGTAIHDSRVIMRYFDKWSGGMLYPADRDQCLEVDRFEAVCDGVCDCLQAIMSEKRFRPVEKIHEPWIDRQWTKVERALAWLERNVARGAVCRDASGAALRGMLGYLSIRFEGQWETQHPGLLEWIGMFDETFPHLAACAPSR